MLCLLFCHNLCLRVKMSWNHWVYFLPYRRLYGLSMEPFTEDLASHNWNISSRWSCTLGLLRCAPSSAPPTYKYTHTHACRHTHTDTSPTVPTSCLLLTSGPICIWYQLAWSTECRRHAQKYLLSVKQPDVGAEGVEVFSLHLPFSE